MTTRRDFLAGASAVAAASVLPLPMSATVVAPSAAPVAPPMLAWAFDISHGDYRSTVIAPTKAEAHAAMINEYFECDLDERCPRRVHDSEDECTMEDCGCTDSGMSSVEREPSLDAAAARGSIEIDDYHRAGWGYVCDRCGGEPVGGDWEVVDGVPVCNDCMTLDEWRVVNPKYAAEMEEEARLDALTDEEYERETTAKIKA